MDYLKQVLKHEKSLYSHSRICRFFVYGDAEFHLVVVCFCLENLTMF